VTHQSVRSRGIGVFQHYALFKHMTIRQNIAFGLSCASCPSPRFGNGGRTLELVQLRALAIATHLSFLVGNELLWPEPWL